MGSRGWRPRAGKALDKLLNELHLFFLHLPIERISVLPPHPSWRPRPADCIFKALSPFEFPFSVVVELGYLRGSPPGRSRRSLQSDSQTCCSQGLLQAIHRKELPSRACSSCGLAHNILQRCPGPRRAAPACGDGGGCKNLTCSLGVSGVLSEAGYDPALECCEGELAATVE